MAAAASAPVNPDDSGNKAQAEESGGDARAKRETSRKSKNNPANYSLKGTSSSRGDTSSNVPAKKKNKSKDKEDVGPAARDGGGAKDRREGARAISGGRESGHGDERRSGDERVERAPKKFWKEVGKTDSVGKAERKEGRRKQQGKPDKSVGAAVVGGGRAGSGGKAAAAGSASDSVEDFNMNYGVKKGPVAAGAQKKADDVEVGSRLETSKRPSSSLKKRERGAEGSTSSSVSLSRPSTTKASAMKGQEAAARREAKGSSKVGKWRDGKRRGQGKKARPSTAVTGGRRSIDGPKKTSPVEPAGSEAADSDEAEFTW